MDKTSKNTEGIMRQNEKGQNVYWDKTFNVNNV
jgi:hypothetical protein